MKVPKIDVAKEDAKWNAYKTVENRLRETWFTFFALICFVLVCVCVSQTLFQREVNLCF